MALIRVVDVEELTLISPKEVEVGMHIFSVERYPNGTQLTFDGIVEKIEVQHNGWRVAHLLGVPHNFRKVPEDIEIELYRVKEPS